MTNDNKKIGIIILFIVLLVILWEEKNTIDELEVSNSELLSEVNSLEYQVDAYQDALEEANYNIEEANSVIEDAQGYAWSDYYEMGEALDNLYTVEIVDVPY